MRTEQNKTILLVEDEVIIAMSEKMQLEKIGYKVLLSHNGEDSVQQVIHNNNIDLVLMDIDLGKEIDGAEAGKRILDYRDLPIVFLSSHTEPEVVLKTEKITSYGYIVKNSGITVIDAGIQMAFKLYDINKKLNLELELHKQLQDKLFQYQQYLKYALYSLPITIFAIDNNGIFTISEGKGLGNVNLEPGENVGASAIEMYSSLEVKLDNGEVINGKEWIFRVLAGEKTIAYTKLAGRIFENYCNPYYDMAGQIIGAVGIAMDITDKSM